MEADSEVGFEDFFQSSMETNREADEDSVSGLDSMLPSCDDFLLSSDNGCCVPKGGEPDVYEALDAANQTFHDFDSESSGDGKGMGVPMCALEGELAGEDDSLHVSRIDLKEADSEMVFSGFTTGSLKRIEVKRESMCSAYRMFAGSRGDVYMPQGGKRAGRPVVTRRASADPEGVYAEVRRRFMNEDENRVFVQFTWSWIYFCFERSQLEPDALVDRIEEQVRIRLESEYSVLRRIAEGDEVPWRYMILLVVGVGKGRIEVFDGYYSAHALCDEALDQRVERNEIRVGFKLKVFGAELERSVPGSIFDEAVLLRLRHNGVQVVHSRRRLGYRKKMSFRTWISGISRDGGPVSCVEGEVSKVVETKYLVKVENYSSVTEDLEPELDKIEDLARKAQRVFSSHDLRISMYTRFVVRDGSGECVVTWWNPSCDVHAGQTVRMVYLVPSKAKELHLSTCKKSYVRVMGSRGRE